MIRINLLEKQDPKHVRELSKATKEFDATYAYITSKIRARLCKLEEDFIMTKEESNLRLLEYDEEIPKLLLTSSIDTKHNSSADSNPSTPFIKK